MKAMILAAGRGTRLQPLTLSIPKALVPVHGTPALRWQIQRLQNVGAQSIMINAHYMRNQVQEYVENYHDSQVSLMLSVEEELLGTGGGVLKTQNFWGEDPFILHNVDVISTADLEAAYQQHVACGMLATLLVQNRKTQNKLIIDSKNRVCGLHRYGSSFFQCPRTPSGEVQEMGFCGIHIISPEWFQYVTESGDFSIIDCYLRMIAEGHSIAAYDIGDVYWKDLGTPARLSQLEHDWKQQPLLRKHHEPLQSQRRDVQPVSVL